MGTGAWIADQLTKTGPDPATEARFPASSVAKRNRDQLRGTNFKISLTHTNYFRAHYSKHQLFEMMAVVWMDHFNIHLPGGAGGREIYHPDYQEKVIRPNAMGRFADLLKATAESEGMMWYLDNHLSDASKAAGINENYGRELLELHTVGVESYSEADVVAAAKIMSGWTVQGRYPANFTFRDQFHANESVSVLGRRFAAGRGKAQGDELLAFLARHPRTARTVATKICRRFVADNPPASLVASAAQVYLDNDTALVPVLRHIFASSEFANSAGQKLRRPMEFVVAAMRATDASASSAESRQMFTMLGELGHRPWWWMPPNGFPDVAPYWADTNGFALRWRFAGLLCGNKLSGIRTNVINLRSGAGTAGGYVNALSRRFGIGDLSAGDVDAILRPYRLSASSSAGSISADFAADIAALVLSHPSFQLR